MSSIDNIKVWQEALKATTFEDMKQRAAREILLQLETGYFDAVLHGLDYPIAQIEELQTYLKGGQ